MAKKTENEVKETKKEAAVMDEAAKEKFQQKLKDLLALAKKKKKGDKGFNKSGYLRTCS